MPMPPDYGDMGPPVKKKRAVGHAWAWVVSVAVVLQVAVSLVTGNFDPVSALSNQLLGAGLGAWYERQDKKQDDVDA